MPSRRMYVVLADDEFDSLRELARSECRHPREQLRLLVREAARARGLMNKTPAVSLTTQPAEAASQAV